MKTKEEIREQIKMNQEKRYPRGPYWEGAKEGYIGALNWVLDE